MVISFERQNELFKKAVAGDKGARDQLIADNMFVAEQVAYSLMNGKNISKADKDDEIQAAYLFLIEIIDSMIDKGVMYNIKYLRQALNNKLMSYYRKEKYGVDNNSMHKNEDKKNKMLNLKNAGSIDDIQFDSCLPDNINVETSVLNYVYIDKLLSILNSEERDIVRMMYFEGMTQKEIGEKLGFNQGSVSKKYKSILSKLKKASL